MVIHTLSERRVSLLKITLMILINDIINLRNIDPKINDENQIMILMCSLLNSYKYFMNIMMYVRNNIPIEDVKTILNLKS